MNANDEISRIEGRKIEIGGRKMGFRVICAPEEIINGAVEIVRNAGKTKRRKSFFVR